MTNPDQAPQTLAEALQQAEALNASLNSRLSSYRDQTLRLRPNVARLYDDLVARLAMLDSGAVGPQIGERMPGFILPNQVGELVSLSSLLRSGPAVISFNRGHWCPYCRLDLRALASVSAELARRGAQVVSIMPDRARYTATYIEKIEIPFPILSDIDLGYSLSLGMIFWLGADIRRFYEEVGIDLDQYQGNASFFLPMAAKFIVGRDGLVKARQVNIEFRARMEPEQIIAAVDELNQAGG
jgi:peroxiredoxin